MKPLFNARHLVGHLALTGACLVMLSSGAQAATAAELLAGYSSSAGAPASPQRGQQFFTSHHGQEWSCATCHGAVPTQAGKHAATVLAWLLTLKP
jgi:mono/diheme cytochrome c family protein